MKLPIVVLLILFLHSSAMGQSYFRNEYAAVWKRASAYTIEVAKAMPASAYGFKPTDENMDFREQMTHLVQNLSYLSGLVTGTPPDFFNGADPSSISKDELCAALQRSFQHVEALIGAADEKTLQAQISFAGENMTKENIFYLMRDHMTHHRGQAIIYLLLNGIVPPKYTGW